MPAIIQCVLCPPPPPLLYTTMSCLWQYMKHVTAFMVHTITSRKIISRGYRDRKMKCKTLGGIHMQVSHSTAATHIYTSVVYILHMRVRVPRCPSRPSPVSLATFGPPVALHIAAAFWSRNCAKAAVSSNSFAYCLFHAVTFERKVFSKLHTLILRQTREYLCLLVSTDAEAAREGTDGYTHRHTRQLP